MQFPVALSMLASTAFFAIPALAQMDSDALCSEVPPPQCLVCHVSRCLNSDQFISRADFNAPYDCIQATGECNMCTTDGAASVLACAEATCGNPPDGENPYADWVYLPSICPNGGFEDYSTSPPHFEVIPPANCSTAKARSWVA